MAVKGKLTFGRTAATYASQISDAEIEKARGEAELGKLGRIVKQLDAQIVPELVLERKSSKHSSV